MPAGLQIRKYFSVLFAFNKSQTEGLILISDGYQTRNNSTGQMPLQGSWCKRNNTINILQILASRFTYNLCHLTLNCIEKKLKVSLFLRSKSCMFSKKQRKQLPHLSLNIVKDIENFRGDKSDPAKLKQINSLQSFKQINSGSRIPACLQEIMYG